MRFLVDAQLPALLARFLQSQGHFTEHVLDLGFGQSKDNILWDYATEQHAIVLTKDEDFADWIARGRPGPCVVWLRIGNCPNSVLLTWFENLWPQIRTRLDRGDRLVEVR